MLEANAAERPHQPPQDVRVAAAVGVTVLAGDQGSAVRVRAACSLPYVAAGTVTPAREFDSSPGHGLLLLRVSDVQRGSVHDRNCAWRRRASRQRLARTAALC